MSVKEYTIYCQYGDGLPFYLNTYKDLISAQLKIYDMVSLEKERRRPYYVDNDFFENEYPSSINGKYFCIKERVVSDWKTYAEKNMKNNIIYFNKNA